MITEDIVPQPRQPTALPTHPITARCEWLEMKQLYRQMQKEQMKELKLQTHEEREGGATPRGMNKPFISRCLLRVECPEGGEEGAVTVDKLRVSHASCF